MDEVIIRPFLWRDGLEICDNPNEPSLKGQPYIERWLKLNEFEGPGYTAVMDGKIIGCGGIRIYWEGVGEAWALYPAKAGNLHLDPKIAKKKLYEMIDEHKLKRVQSTPRCDWPEGLTYAKWLGFKVEGKMKSYLPGENGDLVDCFLMSILKE